MALKYGQVRAVQPNKSIVYYDGHHNRQLSYDLVRIFLGDQYKELKALTGHSIQVVKNRAGRIEAIKVID